MHKSMHESALLTITGEPMKLNTPATTQTPTETFTGQSPVREQRMDGQGGRAAAETVAEDINVLNEYGEGSYVGDEPPAEYTVKANERSMKYHTSDSAGYDRTIADVYFVSTEAAEQAGFSRAQG